MNQTIVSLANRVNDVLNRYVAIHDGCFNFSIRKILPIPKFFKAIDYGSISIELTGLSCELEQALTVAASQRRSGVPSPQEEEFVSALEEYVIALAKTLSTLRNVCNELYKKSKGESGYSMKRYNEEMVAYRTAVVRYRRLGMQLNSFARKVGLKAEP